MISLRQSLIDISLWKCRNEKNDGGEKFLADKRSKADKKCNGSKWPIGRQDVKKYNVSKRRIANERFGW